MSEASAARRAWLPSADDPLDKLPPTARRLLAAARDLLAEGGFRNKRGLVVALVDSLVHDANRALLTETTGLPMGKQRVQALVEGEQRISADVQAFTGFFEVLPHALRDPALRPRVAGLYESYRQTVMTCLGAGTGEVADSRLLPLAALMIAVVDGLSIQMGLDPEGFDIRVPFRTWGAMLAAHLQSEA